MQAKQQEPQVREEVLSIRKLKPSRYQTRHVAFESDQELQNLALSIQSVGLLDPPKVRRLPEDPEYYEIITGHRRIRAITQYLKFNEVKCQIHEGLDEIETFRLALSENVQRLNLSPYEEGRAYLLCEKLFGLSDQEIAEQLHKPKPAVMGRRQLAVDANEYLKYSNDPRITNLFLQNFNLRHRRILRKVRDKQNLARAVTLIAEGSPIRQIKLFVEGARKFEHRAEEYETLASNQKRAYTDIDTFSGAILGQIHKLSSEAPVESKAKFKQVEQMVKQLGEEAKLFRKQDLNTVGLDSVKQFGCPNCRQAFDVVRRFNKSENLEVFVITPKDRKLSKEQQLIVFPKL